MPYRIFTYDRETERKNGALTMLIFSFCVMLFPIFIIIFDVAAVDLWTGFIQADTRFLSSGLFDEAFGHVMCLVFIVLFVSIPLTLFNGIEAMEQLLSCYATLEDGSLVRLKCWPRGSR